MMSKRRNTVWSAALIAAASMALGMVITSQLDMAPASSAQTQTFTTPPMNSAPLNGPIDAGTFREIARTQTDMVVNIRVEAEHPAEDRSDPFGDDDLFRRFFGPRGQQRPREVPSAGTGFVIDASGLILTNNHVVENATKIEIDFFADDERDLYEARVLGRDQLTDSALLELVERPDWELPVATFGDSSQMASGDWVMAIGNPFGLGHTVTVGVISHIGRPFQSVRGRSQEMLQTDAAINPGNSGGPLLNIRGEVVGMNTAIVSDRGANAGVGFAVPINTVRDLLEELRGGKVTRGVIGVVISQVPRDDYEQLGLANADGAVVQSVNPGGPAADAGIEPGDVIVAYGGEPVENTRDVQNRVVATPPGTTVPLDIVRNSELLTLDVTIGELDLAAEARPAAADAREQTSEGFGITLRDLTPDIARGLRVPPDTAGAVVADVQRGSTAAAAGMQQGDIILRVNGAEVATANEATTALADIESGRTAFLLVQRGDSRVFLQVRKE